MSHHHDEQIDRLLTALHRGGGTGASVECLDAETLAAWMDDALRGPALARAEAHAAVCARCQAMLAAMARTADAGADGRGDGAAVRSKFWRMLPWAAPLTAAAAAAVLYVAVDQRSARVLDVAPATQSAPREAKGEAAALPNRRLEADDRSPSPSPPSSRRTTEAAPDSVHGTAPSPFLRRDERAAEAGVRREAEPQQFAAAPPPLPETRVQQPALQDVAKPSARPVPEPPRTASSAARAERPVIPVESAPKVSQFGGRARGVPAAALEPAVSPLVTIATPDPAVRWRFGANLVERSRDGGATWTAQNPGVPGVLVAGSAPSPTVCWLVGRQGLVIRTVDAATWQRIRFPEAVDLTSVTATSADVATVMTADGRTFRTADGGKTWRTP